MKIFLTTLAAMIGLASSLLAKDNTVDFDNYEPWSDEIVETFAGMLVQDGGREKPINTVARYALLNFRGLSTMTFTTKDGEGEKHTLSAPAWLLDVLFRPELARDMPLFIVDDSAAVEKFNLKQKEKRDRYTYNEIVQQRGKLAELAETYAEKQQKFDNAGKNEPKEPYRLTSSEKLVLTLGRNVSAFEFYMGQFSFAKRGDGLVNAEVLPDEMKAIAQAFDPIALIRDLPETTPQDLLQAIRQNAQSEEDVKRLTEMQLLFFYGQSGTGINLFPPVQSTAGGASSEVIESDFVGEEGVRVDDEIGIVFDKAPSVIDNLERIQGIDFQLEQKLHSLGIYRFKQIVSWTPEIAAAIDAKLNLGGRIERDDWKAGAERYAAEEWLSVGDALFEAMSSKEKRPAMLGMLEKVQALDSNKSDPAAFLASLQQLDESVRAIADARDEGQHSEMEVRLIQGGFYLKSLYYFVGALVMVLIGTLSPVSRFGKIAIGLGVALTVVGLGYNVVGIVMRSIIRSRPPITNLFDTIIFITAVAVILCLILEWVLKNRIALVGAVVCGVAGMFLTIRYEASEAVDTMPQLVAVLDTNFWLATHVTIINIGYAAGLVAALFGIIYLIARITGMAGDYKTLTRMTYGIVCFGLLFSLVGTVLGGIWANYSWGRFWGWDPKENGALMIVLFSLVILHAKMGGFIREVGINVMSIALGGIVIFSWWGVNNLGTGLHAYGFTEGLAKILWITYGILAAIMCLGFPLSVRDKREKREGKLSAKGGKAPKGVPNAG